jgi:hypothetical protein
MFSPESKYLLSSLYISDQLQVSTIGYGHGFDPKILYGFHCPCTTN